MKFVSYAQNDEDIMLWRALKSVEHGFYIDVGAAILDGHSVSRAFYEHGWRGVNIEPVSELCAVVSAERPEDINLCIALGAADSEREFFTVPETGLSTLDPVIAEAHRAAGRKIVPGRVRVKTLAEICREYAKDPIHYLKIDVEGAESEVLAGAEFSQFRPWILVIEATWPGRQEASHAVWEPALLEQGYRFVWFDGLNRFYVAAEQADALAPFFRAPPNVWDEFVRFDAAHAKEVDAARAEAVQTAATLAGKEQEFSAGMAAAAAEAFRLRKAYFEEVAAKAELARQLRESEAKKKTPAEIGAARDIAMAPPAVRGGLAPRALAKTLLRPFGRMARPATRPLAWRTRNFLLGPTHER
ncbi:MAG: FkbM family methyltransferase, partial [Acetobacteraceae bacterium]